MTILVVILGYMIGSIPFAYLLARHLRGVDIRRAGSGNVGAANVWRTTGALGGSLVVALDVAKGTVAVLVARQFDQGAATPAAAGMAAILGHIYPIWIGFHGGRGVATACGVFAVLSPAATAAAAVVFVAIVWWTRYVSLGSLVAAVLLAPAAYVAEAPNAAVISAALAGAIIIERHRSNVARLHAGTERRIGQRG